MYDIKSIYYSLHYGITYLQGLYYCSPYVTMILSLYTILYIRNTLLIFLLQGLYYCSPLPYVTMILNLKSLPY